MQYSKSNSPTFRSALSAYHVRLLLASATDVVATVEEEGETHAPIHVRALGRALAHVRVLGLVLDHGLAPRDIAGDVIPTNLRGMVGTVEGVEVGSGLVEEVEGEAGVVDIVKTLGLVLHLVGVPDLHADDRQATSVAGTEGAERGRLHTLCVLVAQGRDLTLALDPVLHVLARGRAPCLTLPTRDTVGAGAGVAHALGLRVVEGGVTAQMTFETAVVGRSHRGISYLYFPLYPLCLPCNITCSTLHLPASYLQGACNAPPPINNGRDRGKYPYKLQVRIKSAPIAIDLDYGITGANG